MLRFYANYIGRAGAARIEQGTRAPSDHARQNRTENRRGHSSRQTIRNRTAANAARYFGNARRPRTAGDRSGLRGGNEWRNDCGERLTTKHARLFARDSSSVDYKGLCARSWVQDHATPQHEVITLSPV